MDTERTLRRLMRTPPIRLEKAVDRLTDAEREAVTRALDGLAEAAAFRGGYLAERYGYGCGDRGHRAAVKRGNRQARRLWINVLGYNAHHPISV